MSRLLCLVAVLAAAMWAALAETSNAQTLATEGGCSPIITRTAGNVTITCNGISDAALLPLAEAIAHANLAAEEAQEKADQWAERYFELSRTIETLQVALASPAVDVARASLEQGQLEEAFGAIKVLQAQLDTQRAQSRASLRQFMVAMMKRGEEPGGVLAISKRWPADRPITVCFMRSDEQQREYVVRLGLEWTLHGGISFDFGSPPAYRTCSNEMRPNVRIKMDERSFWSYVGRDALGVAGGRPTMGLALQPFKPSKSLNFHVLHEFGHVLGLYHIYRHPSACAKSFDWAYISKSLPGGPQAFERLRRDLLGPPKPGDIVLGEYDAQSVMQFELPAQYYIGGSDNPCYGGKITELSLRDKLAMFRTYPF